MYTIWGAVMAMSGSLIVCVYWKGAQWRQAAEAKEQSRSSHFDSRITQFNSNTTLEK